MQVKQAIDEFLSYMQIERNVSVNTIRSYAYDLRVLQHADLPGIVLRSIIFGTPLRRCYYVPRMAQKKWIFVLYRNSLAMKA